MGYEWQSEEVDTGRRIEMNSALIYFIKNQSKVYINRNDVKPTIKWRYKEGEQNGENKQTATNSGNRV